MNYVIDWIFMFRSVRLPVRLHTLGSGGPSLYLLRQAFVGPFLDMLSSFSTPPCLEMIEEFFPAICSI
jgi:hypothetical protein